jgi:hypothetical protein
MPGKGGQSARGLSEELLEWVTGGLSSWAPVPPHCHVSPVESCLQPETGLWGTVTGTQDSGSRAEGNARGKAERLLSTWAPLTLQATK